MTGSGGEVTRSCCTCYRIPQGRVSGQTRFRCPAGDSSWAAHPDEGAARVLRRRMRCRSERSSAGPRDSGHERAPSRASLSLRVGVTDQAEADRTGAPVVADRAHLRHCWPSGCVVWRGAQAVIGRTRFPQKRLPPLSLTDELLLDPPPNELPESPPNEPEPESPLVLAS